MFKIDKTRPIPDGSVSNRYPFPEMEIGDSFFVPHNQIQTNNQVRASASLQGKNLGFKFRTRTVTEDGIVGIRVWRIK